MGYPCREHQQSRSVLQFEAVEKKEQRHTESGALGLRDVQEPRQGERSDRCAPYKTVKAISDAGHDGQQFNAGL